MQRNDNTIELKATKTALLLGVINLITSPAYCVSSSVGLLLTIATNAFCIFQFHELGKARRPGSNLLTRGWSLFSSYVSPQKDANTNEVNNAYRNIINGGAAIADEIANIIDKNCCNKQRL